MHYVTIWLDKKYNWMTDPVLRASEQYILGFILPLLIDFFRKSVFFYLMGENFFEIMFILYDIPLIICLLLNAYYLIYYLYSKTNSNERVVQYLTDTLKGSSGSPVFNSDWEVVALPHSGGGNKPGEPELPKGIKSRNEGIFINNIIQFVKDNYKN